MFVSAMSVIAEPDGATSGILWQDTPATAATQAAARTGMRRGTNTDRNEACSTIRSAKDSKGMNQAGQGKPHAFDPARRRLDDEGYLMVALLIGIAVTAIWMGSLLPSWRQQAVREREAELVFRGEQYARSIALYYRKNQRLPPNIDTLVSQRYLRKKYLDPITGKEFLPVGGVTGQTASPQGSPQGRTTGPGRTGAPGAAPAQGQGQVGGVTGISGVRSTSNDTSIVVYRNQQSYSQFPFDYSFALQKMGVALGGPNGGNRGRGAFGDEVAPIRPGGARGPGGPGGRAGDRGRGAGPGGGPRGGAGGGISTGRGGTGRGR
jgi:type II secretory pathway pseudopilin PulG